MSSSVSDSEELGENSVAPFKDFWGNTRIVWIVLGVPVLLIIFNAFLFWILRKTSCYLPIIRKTSSLWLTENAFRRKLAHLMTDSLFASCWTMFQFIITILSLVHYAATTYYETLPLSLFIMELFLSVCFAADYLIFLYVASNRVQYFFSLLPLIDYLTVVPVFVSLAAWNWQQNTSFRFTPLRMLRALRVVRTLKATNLFSSIITRQILRIVVLMASLIFIGASLIQLVERLADGFQYDFHVMLYFTVVTFSTVGYGDIAPVSDAGQMTMLVLIVLAYVLLPFQLAKFFTVVGLSKDYYLKTYSKRRIRPPPHAVFIGQASNLVDIIQEFLNTEVNPAASGMHVVILAPNKPSAELENVLKRSKHRSRIFFLQGSTTCPQDLDRAQIKSAEFCYIFSQSEHAEQDADHATMLTYLAVKERAKTVPTAVQLYQNRNASTTIPLLQSMDYLFSSNSLNLAILAQCCLCPGYSTFITNLIRTYKVKHGGFSQIRNMRGWQGEYVKGAENELFSLESLPHAFNGMTFAKVAKVLYNYYHVILLGIECIASEAPSSPSLKSTRQAQRRKNPIRNLSRLLPNFKEPAARNIIRKGLLVMLPWDYVIRGGEMAAVIAPSYLLVEAISLYNSLMDKQEGLKDFQTNKGKKKEHQTHDQERTENTKDEKLRESADDVHTKNEEETRSDDEEEGEPETEQIETTTTDSEVEDRMRRRLIQDLLDSIHVEKIANHHPTNGRTALVTPKKVQREINNPDFLSSLGLSNRSQDVSYPPLSLDDIHQKRGTRGELWASLSKRAIKPLSKGKKDVWGSLFHLNPPNSGLPQTLPPPANVIRFKNHLLLIGWRTDMESMILNLRSRNILYPRRIVILSERPPSLPLWRKLSLFPHIYYVEGSGLVGADLNRAAVSSADRIIILDRSSPTLGSGDDDKPPTPVVDTRMLGDAENMFILRAIQSNWPHKALVSSIVDAGNMRFLNEGMEDVYLRKLVNEYSKSQWSNFAYNYLESFAAGKLYTPSVINSLVVQLYWNPRVLNMVKLMTGAGSSVVERICGCNTWVMPVPSGMVGKTFHHLFSYLITSHLGVPVALYRKKQQTENEDVSSDGDDDDDDDDTLESSNSTEAEYEGDEGVELDELAQKEWESDHHRFLSQDQRIMERYVYTNPEPQVQLRTDDKVFVMALSEPDVVSDQPWEKKKKRDMKTSWRNPRSSFLAEEDSTVSSDDDGMELNESWLKGAPSPMGSSDVQKAGEAQDGVDINIRKKTKKKMKKNKKRKNNNNKNKKYK
ncbi:potassium channel, subfamily T, member 2 [Balamuthia mandrillaris]